MSGWHEESFKSGFPVDSFMFVAKAKQLLVKEKKMIVDAVDNSRVGYGNDDYIFENGENYYNQTFVEQNNSNNNILNNG